MIKTFRGQLADGGQDRIRLQTIKGKVGYRIAKAELIPADSFGTAHQELVLKIYKTEQTTINDAVNFTDTDLLGVVYTGYNTSAGQVGNQVVFDKEIFNQDIYVTMVDNGGSTLPGNYYIELEVIPLDDAGAEYTTLKDMRQS